MKIMIKYLKSLYLTPAFLAFVFFFTYAYTVKGRMMVRGTLDLYTFTPEGPLSMFFSALIIFFITGFILKKYVKQGFSLSKIFEVSAVSLLLYILFQNAFGYGISLVFNTVERNFNTHTLLLVNTDYVLDFYIFGAFFMSHFYYQQGKENTKRISEYDRALSEAKITSLKTQLNPHFLFNNLNILDQLIEESPEEASRFLNDFSELYRYVLETSDKRLVSVKDETLFAESYFRLIQQKYDAAYQCRIEGESSGHVPPLSLQLLLENAVKHNLGTNASPVNICVIIDEDKLTVYNNRKPKLKTSDNSGQGLKNLVGQFELLSDKLPEIRVSEEKFEVTIPILR
jgi:hypothetical protein